MKFPHLKGNVRQVVNLSPFSLPSLKKREQEKEIELANQVLNNLFLVISLIFFTKFLNKINIKICINNTIHCCTGSVLY